jgi:hypothetical protein
MMMAFVVPTLVARAFSTIIFAALWMVTRWQLAARHAVCAARSPWRLCLRFVILPGILSWFLTDGTALPETGPDVSEMQVSRAWDINLVRTNIDRLVATLANVAMKEKISRFAGVGGAARELDSFETEVFVVDGVEQYADVRGHNRTYHHISEIRGLWSFGEIVTMLRTTRDIIDSSAATIDEPGQSSITGDSTGRDVPVRDPDRAVVRFQSAAVDHKWFVTRNGRIYWLDFEGAIQISRRTGEIERLTWTSKSETPGAGVAAILWDVNFSTVTIAGDACTVPAESVYRVVRAGVDRKAEWNLTRYNAMGRFGSNVRVRYE